MQRDAAILPSQAGHLHHATGGSSTQIGMHLETQCPSGRDSSGTRHNTQSRNVQVNFVCLGAFGSDSHRRTEILDAGIFPSRLPARQRRDSGKLRAQSNPASFEFESRIGPVINSLLVGPIRARSAETEPLPTEYRSGPDSCTTIGRHHGAGSSRSRPDYRGDFGLIIKENPFIAKTSKGLPVCIT